MHVGGSAWTGSKVCAGHPTACRPRTLALKSSSSSNPARQSAPDRLTTGFLAGPVCFTGEDVSRAELYDVGDGEPLALDRLVRVSFCAVRRNGAPRFASMLTPERCTLLPCPVVPRNRAPACRDACRSLRRIRSWR